MSDNPYQAPPVMVASSYGEDQTLDSVVSMLLQTKPWVRFISVMMFICSALMVLVGFFMMLGGAIGNSPPGFNMGFLGLIYIVMAVLYIVPAVFLWRYADRIALFAQERSTGALALALEAQKSFWKFVGILMLVVLSIYAVIIAFAIIISVVR